MYNMRYFGLITLIGLGLTGLSCNDIEDSPAPGVLRVTLQSDNADTSLVIGGEVLTVTEYYTFQISGDSTIADSLVIPEREPLTILGETFTVSNDTLVVKGNIYDTTLVISEEKEMFTISGDTVVSVAKNDTMNIFDVSVFQGKVYHDSLYATLFTGLSEYKTKTRNYNLLEQVGGRYKQFVIFESYVPPGNYNMLEFGLTASELLLGVFNSPIRLPDGESPLLQLNRDFKVYEDGITEVNLQIRPLESIARYRDSFIFNRVIEITTINHY